MCVKLEVVQIGSMNELCEAVEYVSTHGYWKAFKQPGRRVAARQLQPHIIYAYFQAPYLLANDLTT
jgi:hypothetical protein